MIKTLMVVLAASTVLFLSQVHGVSIKNEIMLRNSPIEHPVILQNFRDYRGKLLPDSPVTLMPNYYYDAPGVNSFVAMIGGKKHDIKNVGKYNLITFKVEGEYVLYRTR